MNRYSNMFGLDILLNRYDTKKSATQLILSTVWYNITFASAATKNCITHTSAHRVINEVIKFTRNVLHHFGHCPIAHQYLFVKGRRPESHREKYEFLPYAKYSKSPSNLMINLVIYVLSYINFNSLLDGQDICNRSTGD